MATKTDFNQAQIELLEAKSFIQAKTHYRPEIAIVCGTGLGGLCDTLEQPDEINYALIPHFPISTVPGHAGKLVFGLLEDKQVVCMKGRVHAYEGHSMFKITFYVRVFALLGIKVVLVTNASGGINKDFNIGDVMVISDHINLTGMAGINPLVGLNDERFGVRFQETTTAYDKQLQKVALGVAKDLNLSYIRQGVYLYQLGPIYESPAEVRFCRIIGADVVGMSTVPEVVVARHCGLRCLGLSLVTNKCVDNHQGDDKPHHEEVMEVGAKRALGLQAYVKEVIKLIEV